MATGRPLVFESALLNEYTQQMHRSKVTPNLRYTIADKHTELGHTVEDSSFNACLGNLPGQGACTQLIAKNDLKAKDGCFS